MEKRIEFLTDYCKNNTPKVLFIFFVLFYILLGTALFYVNYDFIYANKFYAVFDSDSGRVIREFISTSYIEHEYSLGHPFFLLLLSPFVFLFQAFFRNYAMTFIAFQALFGAFCAVLLYLTLLNFTSNKKLSFLSSLIYSFSFSTMVFTIFPETYIFSSFAILCFLYFISHVLKTENLSDAGVFIFSALTVLILGINFSNVLIPVLIILFFAGKFFRGNLKECFKFLGSYFALCVFLTLFLALMQYLCWHVSFISQDMTNDNGYQTVARFLCLDDFTLSNVKYMIVQNFIAPFTAVPFQPDEVFVEELMIVFKKSFNFLFALPAFALYFAALALGLKNFNLIKKAKSSFLILPFIIILAAECVSFLIFGKHEVTGDFLTFLYSQNYLAVLIIFLALLLNSDWNKFTKYLLWVFLLFQIPVNFFHIFKLSEILLCFGKTEIIFTPWLIMLYAVIIAFSVMFLLFILRKLVSKEILELSLEKKCFYIALFVLIMLTVYALIGAVNFWRFFID